MQGGFPTQKRAQRIHNLPLFLLLFHTPRSHPVPPISFAAGAQDRGGVRGARVQEQLRLAFTESEIGGGGLKEDWAC